MAQNSGKQFLSYFNVILFIVHWIRRFSLAVDLPSRNECVLQFSPLIWWLLCCLWKELSVVGSAKSFLIIYHQLHSAVSFVKSHKFASGHAE